MHIKKLRVRPRQPKHKALCAGEMTAMLGCWAAMKDLNSMGACSDAAKALHECMRTTPMGGKKSPSTVNYHLSRLQKVLNK